MPLSNRTQKLLHYYGYAVAAVPGILGIGLLSAFLVSPPEDLESALAIAGISLVLVGLSLFRLRQQSKADLSTPIYTVEDYPLEERRAKVLGGVVVLMIFLACISAVVAYQLSSVEFGWADSAMVWPGFIVGVYEMFGFWPSVLFIPAFGLLVVIFSFKKLREIKAEIDRSNSQHI